MNMVVLILNMDEKVLQSQEGISWLLIAGVIYIYIYIYIEFYCKLSDNILVYLFNDERRVLKI